MRIFDSKPLTGWISFILHDDSNAPLYARLG